MKSSILGLFAVLLLAAAPAVRAEDGVRYIAQTEGSKMKIEGTSTIHDWTVECGLLPGSMEVTTDFDGDFKNLKTPPKVDVTIPVRQLKSGKKSMDAVMQDAMHMKEHAKIEYKLIEMTPNGPDGSKFKFDAKGSLTVSGVTRTNQMAIVMERIDKTHIKVTGATSIKMTDHGIKPPAPDIGLGFIKTGDEVKISFEWMTAQAEAGK